MTKRIIKIQTDRGDLFKIPMDDIVTHSVSPEEITYTLKDGTFIKFFKHSLTYIYEANVEMCECKENNVAIGLMNFRDICGIGDIRDASGNERTI